MLHISVKNYLFSIFISCLLSPIFRYSSNYDNGVVKRRLDNAKCFAELITIQFCFGLFLSVFFLSFRHQFSIFFNANTKNISASNSYKMKFDFLWVHKNRFQFSFPFALYIIKKHDSKFKIPI